MTDQTDGKGRPEDIDVIRDLLAKLEEVAQLDAERQARQSSALPNPPAGHDGLSSLQRGYPGAQPREDAAALPEITVASPPAPLIPVPAPPPALRVEARPPAVQAPSKRGAATWVALGSFALGLATAIGVIIAFEPFKGGTLPWQSKTIADRTAPPKPSPDAPAEAMSAPVAAAPPAAAAAPVDSVTSAVPPTTTDTGTAEDAGRAGPRVATADASPQTTVPPAVTSTPVPIATPPVASPPAVSEPAAQTAPAGPAPVSGARQPPARTVDYRLTLPPTVTAQSGRRVPLELGLSPLPDEAAGLLVVMRRVPDWLTLSKGSSVGQEIWLMPAHLVEGLEIEATGRADATAEVTIQLATLNGRIVSEAATRISVKAAATTEPAPGPPLARGDGALAGDQQLMRLVVRGEMLLDTGDIDAGRTLLRTAAEAGSLAAALKLAETYDPGEVQRLGMAETAADQLEAVRWYEKARALGSDKAAARLEALGRR